MVLILTNNLSQNYVFKFKWFVENYEYVKDILDVIMSIFDI